MKLVTLNIDETEISNLPVDTFKDLVNLEELTIKKSFVKILPTKIFAPLKKLRFFDGKHNKVSKLEEKLFEDNFLIESINFSGNELREIKVDFTQLEKLSEVYLFNSGCINSYFLRLSSTFTLQRLQHSIQKECPIIASGNGT